ncbi:acyl-coenzyme A thioesterase 8-like [Argonauta hians]
MFKLVLNTLSYRSLPSPPNIFNFIKLTPLRLVPSKYSSTMTEIDYSTPQTFMKSIGITEDNLIKYLLGVTNVEPGVFRGNQYYVSDARPIAFGGVLLGQAANAACVSVPPDLLINSFHNYFINAGSRDSLTLQVKIEREGPNSCNKSIHATQNDKTIINMHMAFKSNENSFINHQWKMPECAFPEDLLSVKEILEERKSSPDYESIRVRPPKDPTIDFKPVNIEEMIRSQPLPPKRLTWMRQVNDISKSSQNFHRCVLAYMSDYILITTALLPNPDPTMKMFALSLDHSMWFHNNVNVNEWLLYETESSFAGNGIGFTTGRFWSREGHLIASVSQSGILRKMKPSL